MNLYRKIRESIKSRKRYKKRLARLAVCGQFSVEEMEGIKVARSGDLNLGHIFDGDGVLIVEEIFKQEEYCFDCGGPTVVIDIGMNIGLASLYFASREDVHDVYGFEPFRPTYEQALFNFRINPGYAGKIHPCCYGLGSEDKVLALEYYARTPGRMSTVKTIDEIHPSRNYGTTTETVQIRNAADDIRLIAERHRDKKILVKCDTEGSEKEIFENLQEKGVLKDIDMIIVEYHFSYDVCLQDIFRKSGFVFFKQKTAVHELGESGVIRAVRK